MGRKEAIAKMQGVLRKRREKILKVLSEDLNALTHSDRGGDFADNAHGISTEAISSKLAEAESQELIQIDNALEQIRTGRYGSCEGCNANIPMTRLQALPYAIFCIKCQGIVEQAGANVGNRSDWSHLFDLPLDGDRMAGTR
ncbi:MAG: TraR/DksA C4-type zinc finger protein [Pirellulaceae bacterium]|nr:TraR/DksA C4-type zinc finger protein [Pirellulaceae bacterium]